MAPGCRSYSTRDELDSPRSAPSSFNIVYASPASRIDTSICGYFLRENHTSSLPRLNFPSASSSSCTGVILGPSNTGSSFLRYLSDAAHRACDFTMGLLKGSRTAASEERLKKSTGVLMKD